VSTTPTTQEEEGLNSSRPVIINDSEEQDLQPNGLLPGPRAERSALAGSSPRRARGLKGCGGLDRLKDEKPFVVGTAQTGVRKRGWDQTDGNKPTQATPKKLPDRKGRPVDQKREAPQEAKKSKKKQQQQGHNSDSTAQGDAGEDSSDKAATPASSSSPAHTNYTQKGLASAGRSLNDQMEKVVEWHEKGLIDEEEFRRLKAEIFNA